MNAAHFDALARSCTAPSRRILLATFLVGALIPVSFDGAHEGRAKKGKGKSKERK
jgi:hypothetical protein